MPKPLDADTRSDLRAGWKALVIAVRKAYRMTQTDLAAKCGVGRDTACRWEMDDDTRGTIPGGAARKILEQLAKDRGLIRGK